MHLEHNNHPRWVCIYLHTPILNTKSHMLWLFVLSMFPSPQMRAEHEKTGVFSCSACFLHPPMHAEHKKIPTLVPFCAWCPFLHLWCMLSTKRHQHWSLLVLGAFPTSMMHAEHEYIPHQCVFMLGAFTALSEARRAWEHTRFCVRCLSTCWEWFTLSIKSFQHDEGPAPSLNIYILLNTF